MLSFKHGAAVRPFLSAPDSAWQRECKRNDSSADWPAGVCSSLDPGVSH